VTFTQTAPNAFKFKLVNSGTDPIVYWYFVLPDGSTVAAATADSGVPVVLAQPDGKANEVEFGPTSLPSEESADGTVTTAAAVACGGWQVVINTTNDPKNYKQIGDVTFQCSGSPPPPPPPPAAPPPPPPPQEKPCRCLLLTARILPDSVTVEPLHEEAPKNIFAEDIPVKLVFTIHWILNCSQGTSGECKGHLVTRIPDWAGGYGSFHFTSCTAPCAELRDGTSVVTTTHLTRAKLAEHKLLRVTVERTCQEKKVAPIHLWIAFDKVGRPALAKSKLR
jgi:hypothetical protein